MITNEQCKLICHTILTGAYMIVQQIADNKHYEINPGAKDNFNYMQSKILNLEPPKEENK